MHSLPKVVSDRMKRMLLVDTASAQAGEATEDSSVEFNQLKFVCKELYSETAGLEIRYNDLLIQQTFENKLPVAEQHQLLVNHIGESRFSWLSGTTITLENTLTLKVMSEDKRTSTRPFPCTVATAVQVAEFCRANPTIQIRLISPGFNVCPSAGEFCLRCFMVEGVRNELLLRDRHLGTDIPHVYYHSTMSEIQTWLGEVAVKDVRAPNFRVSPGNIIWNDDFQDFVESFVHTDPECTGVMAARWCEHIERWIREGI
ncbi:hypothetical protein CC86DRAFT_385184 [Ophiobolus disseminans]|uniref:Uncharacterized protein n=1 Tax=Ophiobolus disseminans TaxID=1469910 RepID=A0A6A6ZRR5_9PLEO|nr:hypothetical protein CC86DRAFT_385184 [Ophiobolus disseminans]